MFITLNILSSLIIFCHGANILAILPMPFYSHQIAYRHIWRELSLRGHKVTLVTANPLKDPKLTNLTEIDMNWTYKTMENVSKLAHGKYGMWNNHPISHEIMKPTSEAYVSHNEIQNLRANRMKFDVVLVEFLFPEFLVFGEIFNCPTIMFSSLDVTAIMHWMLGNSINPVLYPELGATFYGILNFKERVISTLLTWHTMYFYYYEVFYQKTQLVKKYFNVSTTVPELINKVDLMFINVNPILQPIRAVGPATITISGDRSVLTSTTLPKDIAEFLDNAADGFIYFSLGSKALSKDLNSEVLQTITEVFRELPYKVLWKFESDTLPNKPENVKLIKWAPQVAILSHSNIKLFITQGGLQSIEEAFYREVPLVIIPLFGDQELNARIMEWKGFAVVVNRNPSLKKVELKNAIVEVITNPKYRDTVKILKNLALDTPVSGLEKAIWWTEYVIRNKGAKHLRNPGADLPLCQYFLFDVIGFLVLATTAICLFVYYAFKVIYYKCFKLLISSILTKPVTNKRKFD